MRSEIIQVTPDKASKWLRKNTSNRYARPGYVRQLADAMRRGEWQLTHQGVAFGQDGALKDGQHRLLAVVESGKTIEMMVTWDVAVNDIRPAPFDIHAKRTMADVLGGDRKAVEVGTLAANICEGTRLTPTQVKPYVEALYPLAAQLLDACGSSAKSRSTAGVKLGAALNLHKFGPVVCDQYRALVLLQYEEMTISVRALLRQLDTEEHRRGNARIIAARAFRAFDMASQLTKIQIPKTNPAQAVKDAIFALVTSPE